jgi:hypothetical protein
LSALSSSGGDFVDSLSARFTLDGSTSLITLAALLSLTLSQADMSIGVEGYTDSHGLLLELAFTKGYKGCWFGAIH